MNRLVFWGMLLSLLLAVIFGLAWMGWISIPLLVNEKVEGFAFLYSSLCALVAFVYGLYEKAYPKPTTPHYLAAPPAHLLPGILPRPDELRQLYRQLQQTRKPVVICGVGGLGKTTFAQQFCQLYGGKFDQVVWLSAAAVFSNDPAQQTNNAEYFLRAFIDNTALLTNLSIKFEEQETPFQRFEKVCVLLGNIQARLLIVVDNVPESAARYVDDLSRLHNARILLTSRETIHNMEPFELGTLSPDKAAQVFCNIYGKRSTDPKLDELLQTYSYHTLTIELLAAYAREKNLSVAELHAELQEKSLLQLDNYHLSLPNTPKRQSLRERLLYTFLLELDEQEQEIMRYMCILPTDGAVIEPDLMSEEALANHFGKTASRVDFHNVLDGLSRLHWLVKKDGDYRCHPVIAETAKAQLQPDAVNCKVLIENVTKLLVPDEATNESILNRAHFAPLAEAVFKGVWKERGNFGEEDDTVVKIATRLDGLFSNLGEYYKALGYGQMAIAIREKILSPQHPNLAGSYLNHAETYREIGEYQKSLDYNLKVLAIFEKVLPPEHPNLAKSYNNLALTYGALDEHHKSLAYNQKALAIREKVLPVEHPDLAQSYYNTASAYHALGDLDKAVSFVRRAVDIWGKSLPPAHPHIAMAKESLAFLEAEMGKT